MLKRIVLLSLLSALTGLAVQASSLVQGRIYLKDGRVIECAEKDRIEIPRYSRDVKLLRRAFYKDKSKETYPFEAVDSIVCWHVAAPDHLRTFIPAEQIGWMWVYMETPYIGAYVYSEKGFGIDNNGGIEVLYKQRSLSRSRTAYYLRKTGDTEFQDVGSASRNAKEGFRERIVEYISDDPALAELICQTRTSNRSKIILMLEDYIPQND